MTETVVIEIKLLFFLLISLNDFVLRIRRITKSLTTNNSLSHLCFINKYEWIKRS